MFSFRFIKIFLDRFYCLCWVCVNSNSSVINNSILIISGRFIFKFLNYYFKYWLYILILFLFRIESGIVNCVISCVC